LFREFRFAKPVGINAAGVSAIDRCYEPASVPDIVVAISELDGASPMFPNGFDHELVIGAT
jgi:hypothetical protein